MKRILLLLFALIIFNASYAQTVIFFDDFEDGSGLWDVDGYWDVTDEESFSGDYSFNESPYDATYVAGVVQTATMDTLISLSGALDAAVKFKALIDLEEGFDYTYLDASDNGGDTWITIATFNGEDMLDEWMEFEFPLGAFVGSDEFKMRFRFVPDFFVEYDGMYIDDFTITISNIDVSPPLILHTPSHLYEGTLESTTISATLLDATGISATSLFYSLDGSPFTEVTGTGTSPTDFIYVIPEQAPGVWVDYYISATDSFYIPNTAISDTFSYIAGNYIVYDDGTIDYVQNIGDLGAYLEASVQISLPGATDLVAIVIQNYTDFMRPNDSITVHIRADNDGLPGDDLITPFKVKPEANLTEPNKGTRVDLRDYIDELTDLTGDIFIGYSADSSCWLSQTTPGIAARTYVRSTFGGWFALTDDYHFRAITSEIEGAPDAFFAFDLLAEPNVAFTDLSTNSPTSWAWDFGDGATSTIENPTHTFTANGNYYVCLTASNATGSGTHCEFVTIDTYAAPLASFSYSGDPLVEFTDLSINDPDSWSWNFGDGASSTLQNPTHTYSFNGNFTTCLTATNFMGSSTDCQIVSITGNVVAPVADFTYAITGNIVTFTDLSTNEPTFWGWNFNDGTSSTEQNPIHTYTLPGDYEVCLTAGNIAGTNSACKFISIATDLPTLTADVLQIYPNPASDLLNIHFAQQTGGKQMSLYNAAGQLVFQSTTNANEYVIDVSMFANGMYRFEVIMDNRKGIYNVWINK